MKVTKRQLRRIIKEERRKLSEANYLSDEAIRQMRDQDDEAATHNLYVNLSDDQLQCLDDLTACMERCRRLGIPEADIADTIRSGGF